jgi:hypothetical protein
MLHIFTRQQSLLTHLSNYRQFVCHLFLLMAEKQKARGRPPHQTAAARARRASVDPVIGDLIAWRRQHSLSQAAAAQWALERGFLLTAAAIRMWEEGWRRPRPHTLALLRRFLDQQEKPNAAKESA